MDLTDKPSKFVPSQSFAGLQVIDTKGAVIGNVKDVSVDFRNKALAFRITTKARAEMDVSWDDVLSVEDVVLLKKELDLTVATVAPATLPTIQTAMICPKCGASAPGHAKFCPRCGAALT
jgi:sporulation protein YlmC with PRC-barrel domain